jgi:hypothetical protein
MADNDPKGALEGDFPRRSGWGRVLAAVACAAAMATVVLLPPGTPSPVAQAAPPGPKLPDGMDENVVKKIDLGITYLVRTQRNNGAWFSSGGGYGGAYPSVMTSLAGLALIANGSTPETGPYWKNVKKAMEYILNVAEAQEDGMIAGPGSESRSMYGHGFSMLFLAQCYGTEINTDYEKRIKKALEKAIRLTEKAQSNLGAANKYAGGWIYNPTPPGDEGSVTVTQLQALRACRNAGLYVNKATIDRAVEYLRICQNADGGISYSFQSRGASRPAISAAAIACFYAAGVYDRQGGGAESPEAKMVQRLVEYVKKTAMPEGGGGDWGGYWFYTQLYMGEAMYQRGGPDWPKYYKQIKDKLLAQQMPDGSWNGDGVGTVYGTAIAEIILQLPYGYLPICQR